MFRKLSSACRELTLIEHMPARASLDHACALTIHYEGSIPKSLNMSQKMSTYDVFFQEAATRASVPVPELDIRIRRASREIFSGRLHNMTTNFRTCACGSVRASSKIAAHCHSKNACAVCTCLLVVVGTVWCTMRRCPGVSRNTFQPARYACVSVLDCVLCQCG